MFQPVPRAFGKAKRNKTEREKCSFLRVSDQENKSVTDFQTGETKGKSLENVNGAGR